MTLKTKLPHSSLHTLTSLNQHDLDGVQHSLSHDFMFHSGMGILNKNDFLHFLDHLLLAYPGLRWEKDTSLTENSVGCDIYLNVRFNQELIARQIWRLDLEKIRTIWHFNGGSAWGTAHDLCVSQGNPFLQSWVSIQHAHHNLN